MIIKFKNHTSLDGPVIDMNNPKEILPIRNYSFHDSRVNVLQLLLQTNMSVINHSTAHNYVVHFPIESAINKEQPFKLTLTETTSVSQSIFINVGWSHNHFDSSKSVCLRFVIIGFLKPIFEKIK